MVSTNLYKQKGGFGGCGARVNTPGVTMDPFVGGKRRRSKGRKSPKRSRKKSQNSYGFDPRYRTRKSRSNR